MSLPCCLDVLTERLFLHQNADMLTCILAGGKQLYRHFSSKPSAMRTWTPHYLFRAFHKFLSSDRPGLNSPKLQKANVKGGLREGESWTQCLRT